MLNRLLALTFVLLLLGKMFFRPQFAAVQKWFDGLINAMLIAIVLVYSLQALLWMSQ